MQYDMKTRKYQQELVDHCKKGNQIIVAPTGSGKTVIAGMLVQHVLESNKDKNVLFLVHHIPLVEQQGRVLENLLKKPFSTRVGMFSGENWKSGRWSDMRTKYSVLVMTVKLLVNELERNPDLLKDIQLIIFDECHNARKNHPYRVVMKDYYFPFKQSAEKAEDVPKILGLSASPAARDTVGQTFLDLLDLCIDLDCKVRQVEENYDELKQYIFEVPHEPLYVPLDKTSYMFESKIFDALQELYTMRCKGEIDSSTYGNLAPKLRESIMINDDRCCSSAWRTICDFIDENITKQPAVVKALDKAGLSKQTFNISHLPSFSAKQEKLVSLLEEFRGATHFKALVFVKTRIGARELAHYLEHSRISDFIKLAVLLGHGSKTASAYGMTGKQQNQIVSKFKQEDVNVVIATSVAEEGLDIPSCNLVVRMHGMNSAKELIQTRGRARHKTSKFFSIYHQDSTDVLKAVRCSMQAIRMTQAVKLMTQVEDIVEKARRKVNNLTDTNRMSEDMFNQLWYSTRPWELQQILAEGFKEHVSRIEEAVSSYEPMQLLTYTFQRFFNREPLFVIEQKKGSPPHSPLFDAYVHITDEIRISLQPTESCKSKKDARLCLTSKVLKEFMSRDFIIFPQSVIPLTPEQSDRSIYDTEDEQEDILDDEIPQPVEEPATELTPSSDEPVRQVIAEPGKVFIRDILNKEKVLTLLSYFSQANKLEPQFKFDSVPQGIICTLTLEQKQTQSSPMPTKKDAKCDAAYKLFQTHFINEQVPLSL